MKRKKLFMEVSKELTIVNWLIDIIKYAISSVFTSEVVVQNSPELLSKQLQEYNILMHSLIETKSSIAKEPWNKSFLQQYQYYSLDALEEKKYELGIFLDLLEDE